MAKLNAFETYPRYRKLAEQTTLPNDTNIECSKCGRRWTLYRGQTLGLALTFIENHTCVEPCGSNYVSAETDLYGHKVTKQHECETKHTRRDTIQTHMCKCGRAWTD